MNNSFVNPEPILNLSGFFSLENPVKTTCTSVNLRCMVDVITHLYIPKYTILNSSSPRLAMNKVSWCCRNNKIKKRSHNLLIWIFFRLETVQDLWAMHCLCNHRYFYIIQESIIFFFIIYLSFLESFECSRKMSKSNQK